jgi:hypothetical protein
MQGPLHFELGSRYRVSFRAGAEKATDMELNAGKASQHWDSYSGKRIIALGPEMTDHSFDFRMWAPTDTEARLEFNLGGTGLATVYLDDVRVALLEQGTALVLEDDLKLEAEAFDEASGIDSEQCVEGGRNVGWWDPGDWAEFEIDVATAGTYRVAFRFASMQEGAGLKLSAGGGDPVVVGFPVTGDWQNWETAPLGLPLPLPAGPCTIRLECVAPGFNLNWIRFTRQGPAGDTKQG